MEESIWNAINNYFGNDLKRPLSRARVEVLYGLVKYEPKVVMMKYRIKIKLDYYMMTEEEIADAQAAADAADVFDQLENSPVRDAEQLPEPRNLSTAERAAKIAVNAASAAARVLSASALCGGKKSKRERDRNITTAEQKKESGKSNPDTKNTKIASLKSDESVGDESK